MSSPVVSFDGLPRAVVAESTYYGLRSLDLVSPLRRFYGDGAAVPPLLTQYVDVMRTQEVASPASLIGSLPEGDNWLAQSSRSLARLHAFFMVSEDPQQRLVGHAAATLAHQASLVRHVLTSSHLNRVLIADEVGLGKTIEAGLIIKALLDQRPGLRVLYLAPARLVRNVHEEFGKKLELSFRQFSADDRARADIRTDSLVVASIHRAVHPANRDAVVAADPWDVIVVDECHHLSASKPGQQGANEQFALVRALIERQSVDGRLILMSGTPHQGSRTRFENLVRLLVLDDEEHDAVRGRVIFRTKDDVRDWHGRPLFPKRDVRSPVVVTLGSDYQQWYDQIARLYDDVSGSAARRRAGGWAKGQALQWAASSVEAGTGFLVRLAIRRLGWDLQNMALRDAIAALRPYKGGASEEPIEEVFQRIRHQIVRQQASFDVEDMEELEDEAWRPDSRGLQRLLEQAVRLVKSSAASEKWRALKTLLAEAGREKVVLFAQPVETVAALVRFLKSEFDETPAIIIGGQSDDERDAQIAAFRRPDGPRLLVSSRAGGEGLNLQVARRLVHVDVPWNPMEMEQRVGRVHRFGSRRTIIVDTLVVQGTREVDAYRVAREKLATAFGDLASDPSRFETLFARVMALIPPQEFEDLLGKTAPGTMSGADRERLGTLVEEGLQRWQEFHERFAEQHRAIQTLDPGAASWDDLVDFLVGRCGAERVEGCTVPDFSEVNGEIVLNNVPVQAVRLDGDVYACGDLRGDGASDGTGKRIPMIGLNSAAVTARLRAAAFPDLPSGAAWLRVSSDENINECLERNGIRTPFGLLVFARQTIHASQGTAVEQRVELRAAVVETGGSPREIAGEDRATILRSALQATRQRGPLDTANWASELQRAELELLPLFGRPADEEMQTGVRHAIWPIFAGVIA